MVEETHVRLDEYKKRWIVSAVYFEPSTIDCSVAEAVIVEKEFSCEEDAMVLYDSLDTYEKVESFVGEEKNNVKQGEKSINVDNVNEA